MVTHQKLAKKMKTVFSCFSRQESSDGGPLMRNTVIVGDGECGKTSVVTRMTTGHYVDVGYVPTVYDTHVLDVASGQQHVQLCINDTAGQEDYDRLRPFSYHDIDVVLICFSLADPDSLVNVHERWAPEVRYFCGNVPTILVGNKKDLRDAQSSPPKGSSLSSSCSSTNSLELSVSPTSTSTPKCNNGRLSNPKGTGGGVGGSGGCDKPSTSMSERKDVMSAFFNARPVFNAHAPIKHNEGAIMAKRIGAHAYFETSALTGENVEELLTATAKAAVLGSKKSKKFKPFAETMSSWRSLDYLPNK